ncbi:MAG: hypothetical protein VKL59_16660 [Nostocaceae cyanobacterium]|nr:hypothetical protein [Nostocaceae cyanobacterium]
MAKFFTKGNEESVKQVKGKLMASRCLLLGISQQQADRQAQQLNDEIIINFTEVFPQISGFWKHVPHNFFPQPKEIMTGGLDADTVCYCYPGYQLFANSYKRGEFLVKLPEKYRQHSFIQPGNELAKHLLIVLWFPATKKTRSNSGTRASRRLCNSRPAKFSVEPTQKYSIGDKLPLIKIQVYCVTCYQLST